MSMGLWCYFLDLKENVCTIIYNARSLGRACSPFVANLSTSPAVCNSLQQVFSLDSTGVSASLWSSPYSFQRWVTVTQLFISNVRWAQGCGIATAPVLQEKSRVQEIVGVGKSKFLQNSILMYTRFPFLRSTTALASGTQYSFIFNMYCHFPASNTCRHENCKICI